MLTKQEMNENILNVLEDNFCYYCGDSKRWDGEPLYFFEVPHNGEMVKMCEFCHVGDDGEVCI